MKKQEVLTEKAILASLPEGWHYIITDDCISKDFEKENFLGAVAFVNAIAPLAESADHHPDLMIHDYKNVEVLLTSHDAGGVTQKDIDLAVKIDAL